MESGLNKETFLAFDKEQCHIKLGAFPAMDCNLNSKFQKPHFLKIFKFKSTNAPTGPQLDIQNFFLDTYVEAGCAVSSGYVSGHSDLIF